MASHALEPHPLDLGVLPEVVADCLQLSAGRVWRGVLALSEPAVADGEEGARLVLTGEDPETRDRMLGEIGRAILCRK